MSLDKFVMRGFTGSLGSGQGRWVSSSQQPTQTPSAAPHSAAETTFIFGGKGRVSKGPYSKQRGDGYSEERYSFNAESVRYEGTHTRDHEKKESRRDRRDSLEAAESSGEKLGPAIIIVAILLCASVVGVVSLAVDSPSVDDSGQSLLQRRRQLSAER